MVNSKSLSWGRIFSFEQEVVKPFWVDDIVSMLPSQSVQEQKKSLAVGYGRSYGDSCLNEGGRLIDMTSLRRLIRFDQESGLLTCEGGVSFEDILKVSIPKGWFLPVTPGTMYVSVGGAIANDVHGKNHHVAGTFGQHVKWLRLLRGDGRILDCSLQENAELFCATIGGLGLTGVIQSARIQLKKISSPMIDQETIKFKNIDEFFRIEEEYADKFDYTVAWIDSLASGGSLGRGLYMAGNHADGDPDLLIKFKMKPSLLQVPFALPSLTLNKWTVAAFNRIYYEKQRPKISRSKVEFGGFFYPLDGVKNWNLIYGSKGFRQFQFVVPQDKREALIVILEIVAKSGMSSFLTVVKKFGACRSPGMLSFPSPGYTVAFDFPNRDTSSLRLLDRLTDIVLSNQGKIYPAKDAYMSREQFGLCFSRLEEFAKFVDPMFCSNFWTRAGIIQK